MYPKGCVGHLHFCAVLWRSSPVLDVGESAVMAEDKKPNIILILTDNQQASTLGCYGNAEVHTPNLDYLSASGVTLENAFCPHTFCSPCRASVLTGLTASQHGIHSWIDDRKADGWPEGWHALDGFAHLPGRLKALGYTTALCGKYHLGETTSPMPGFDHWVTMADGHVRSFYSNDIFDNGETYTHHGHSVDFFTDKAIAFMEAQAEAGDPFFLYLPYPAPYGHWPATREAERCRHSDRYDDCPMESVPRQAIRKDAVDGFLMKNANSGGGLDYSMLMRAPNDLATLRTYYAQISMVDDGVGRLIEALDRLGLEDDTIVIFTADHGLSVGQHGFWGHGAATFPANMHHAVHSVPLIVKYGDRFPAGLRPRQIVHNMDVFATLAEMLGFPEDGPDPIAARSFLSVLTGGTEPVHAGDVLVSEQEETRVARSTEWCLFQRFKQAEGFDIGDALFDLKSDPGETVNLADDPACSDVKGALEKRIAAYFDVYRRPETDLWQGGHTIQNTERLAFWKAAWGADWAPVFRAGEGQP